MDVIDAILVACAKAASQQSFLPCAVYIACAKIERRAIHGLRQEWHIPDHKLPPGSRDWWRFDCNNDN